LHFLQRSALTALAVTSIFATTLLVSVPVSAQNPITVTLNGNPVNLNPPPVERAGRVFVPLRGVFERMGATVVYDNGQINATGRSHNISLTIGSNQAIVDGQTQMLDVAPFIIGASTYVPLRFLSQSLGAQVNWDNNNDVVALSVAGARYGGGPRYGVGGPPNEAALPPATDVLRDVYPQNDAFVRGDRPEISAGFADSVNPNSIRIYLDGVDVTDQATRSHDGIVFQPPSPLQPMTHRVRISGRDANGQPFEQSWTFTTGNGM
jgi:hypothetical protein